MTSTSTVTLKTERGWRCTTTLDDPLFSDILAPYVELGEDVSEVMLEGSVAEVIEKEWDWWQKLPKEYSHEEVTQYTRHYSPSLGHFSTILNIPPHWRLYVTVDRESMEHDQLINHYTQLAEVLEAVSKEPTYDGVTAQCIGSMLEGLVQGSTSWTVLVGISWVAWLKWLLRSRRGDCALLMVDWDTFSAVIAPGDIEGEDFSKIPNTIALLQGKGNLLARAHFGVSNSATWDEISLYKRLILNQFKFDSISLRDVGLGFLVEDYSVDYSIPQGLLQISMAHDEAMGISNRVRLHRGKLPMSEFTGMGERILFLLGMQGLQFVYNIVDYHFTHGNYSGTHERRITVFRAFLEQAFIDGQERASN